MQTTKSLDNYKSVSGKVASLTIKSLATRKDRNAMAVVITIQNSPLQFGLQNKYRGFYNALKEMNIVGKKIKIFHNPTGKNIEENLTLWVGQIEIENEIFFPLSAKQEYDLGTLKFQIVGQIIITIILILSLYLYIKGRSPVANSKQK